ncbi:MAG: hypothetical protein FWB96_07925 [Defluviitaleaceae bacterium]|nr:hypothetical protein [Defluviitaleaceae bacterium]MCL2262839.1 hypothetical protein [Defluviitaleaceae bacterium]
MTAPATVVIALFFGFVIAYMGLRAYGVFSQDVEIMTLRLGNMADQQSVPGMIIRHEEVFHAGRDGHVFFTVQEFERVRGGVPVASIRDVEAVARTGPEWEQLKLEIMRVHEMRHATMADPLVERVNADLRNRMNRSMHHHMQSNLGEVYALLNTLSDITYSRTNLIINESVHARNDLIRQHDILSLSNEMNLSDIYATQTGIMSPIIDGFEYLVTPDNMRDLSREEVRREVDHDAIIPAREVEAGDGVFKIVSSNRWYVASYMPHEMTQGLAEGMERTIFLENTATGRFEPVPVRIEYLHYHHHDAFIIFRATINMTEFLHQRNVNIRITDSVQSGFMIPVSAIATRRFFRVPLTHVHGTEDYFVIHRRDTVPQPVLIHIYERTNTHVYILEDSIMLFPGDALSPVDALDTLHIMSETDMRIVHGVYRTRLNYADFRMIHFDGEIPAYGNILLDPARNPLILQFDGIVTDAAMVRQGQVVR